MQMYSYLIFLFFVFSIAPVINKVLNWKKKKVVWVDVDELNCDVIICD